jgi:hypothetical protein
MKLDKEDFYSDDLTRTQWLGKVVDVTDSDKEGKIKIQVFGKFDTLDPADIPWAFPVNLSTSGGATGSGSISIPKLDSIVAVRFDNGNIYYPEYYTHQYITDDLKAEIANSYPNVHSLLYDTEIEGAVKLFYTDEKGFNMSYNDNLINIIKDNSIILNNKNLTTINIKNDDTIEMTANGGKIIHIQKDKISLGKEGDSDEPAVLGEKNVAALKEISQKLQETCDALNTLCTGMSSVCSSVAMFAPLAAPFVQLQADILNIKSFLSSTTDATTIPQTRSSSVTLDGPSMS